MCSSLCTIKTERKCLTVYQLGSPFHGRGLARYGEGACQVPCSPASATLPAS